MKRLHLLWILAAILFLAGLAACAAPAAPPAAAPAAATAPAPAATATPQPTPAQKITLHVQSAAVTPTPVKSQEMLKYEDLHPNITLEYLGWGWSAPKFAQDLTDGRVPDVMAVPATEGDMMIGNGYVVDITDWLNTYPTARDFNPAILGPYTRNGRNYGIPISVYVMGLFYDKALFKKAGLVDAAGEPVPPTTWQTFATAAQTIKQKTGVAGFCMLTQINQGGWTFMNWGWQAGAEFERQSGAKWVAPFDEPPAVQALQFIKDLRWKYDALQPELKLDAGASFALMAEHKCGMALVVPDWLGGVLTGIEGNLALADVGLTTLPEGPAGHAAVLGAGYMVVNAKAAPEVQRAAVDWAMFNNFDPFALEVQLSANSNPSPWAFMTRSLIFKPNSPTVQKERALLTRFRDFPYYKSYLEQAAQYARPEPPIAAQELYATLDKVIMAVLEDKNADPQALLTAAAKEFQAKYLDKR